MFFLYLTFHTASNANAPLIAGEGEGEEMDEKTIVGVYIGGRIVVPVTKERTEHKVLCGDWFKCDDGIAHKGVPPQYEHLPVYHSR